MPPQTLAETTKPWITILFSVAVLYQITHWIEHVAKAYQHWWLGISLLEARGILFFFDLEWNHFVFNTLYWAALLAVFFAGRFFKKESLARQKPLVFYGFLGGGLFLQSYHQVEHLVRIIQHVALNCQPCPGILGWYFDEIYLHFILNSVALVFPLIAFFAYGYFKRLISIL